MVERGDPSGVLSDSGDGVGHNTLVTARTLT